MPSKVVKVVSKIIVFNSKELFAVFACYHYLLLSRNRKCLNAKKLVFFTRKGG